MIKQQAIKLYYNSYLKIDGMPPFEDLTETEKQEIGDSLGFAGWWLNYEAAEVFRKWVQDVKIRIYLWIRRN